TLIAIPATAKMTSSTSAQFPLHEKAWARGETFTLKQIIHYLGENIILKQLYDEEQHMVYCEGDQLGDVLGRESFSKKIQHRKKF
uniref:DM2 domain-containing protein n=1 Tax=Anolis carolinensis TaxID=28377 RepID=A0A803TY48_ANOCA